MTCPICSGEARLRASDHPGFARGLAYEIFECRDCGVSFAGDRTALDWLYAKIYEQPEKIEGYERYERHAQAVERSSSPLKTLAAGEDVYFAIAEIFRELRFPKTARILEIGCGLGYLTYALVRAGYNARGWDISEPAIASAIARFGPHYAVKDANNLDEGGVRGAFDAVIFTSFIEHVHDPIAFVQTAKALLAPGGVLLLTTDNKSYFTPAPIWYTDLPPVHLWWFTEKSIDAIAERSGMRASFFDFADYNRDRPWERPIVAPLDVPVVTPRLDEHGAPIGELAAPDVRSLFPLNRSVFPAIMSRVRAFGRKLRGSPSHVHRSPHGRRLQMAVVMRSPD